jgi:cytochrome oxidase assembly protein ShyY1
LVVLFATATSLLSWWQFDRRQERVAKIELVISNYDKPPVPLREINWEISDGVALDEWRPVTVQGRYLPDATLLVRNRPLSGQAGFLQLVPFQLQDGRILIVERGWLIAGNPITTPYSNPVPDDRPRELTLRLRVGEQDRSKPEVTGQLHSIHLPSIAESLGNQVITDYYGRLVSENPSEAVLPLGMPRPSLDEGNHLSYALQWVLFGLMAFGAFIWAYRNERRLQKEASGEWLPKISKRSQAQIDAEIEDAQ